MESAERHQEFESTTALCRPCIQDNRNSSDSLEGDEVMTLDQCDKIREMDDSQLVGDAGFAVRGEDRSSVETAKVSETSMGKRRRGRPSRSPGNITALTNPPQRKKRDEEDVCFICFDGGNLVLCDRRGCPKAYHPPCVKRDEAFFRSRAKWNCGWHICSSCQKASHYMCYTCTYSLCKGCTKDADYVCVRGNKGFCGTCMRTILLIENSASGNNETVQVDFDDKSSWEYLFKVYWVCLKEKISLSLDELTKAKNPWKGNSIKAPKGESLNGATVGNAECSNFENSCGDLGGSNSKRRKTTKQQILLNKEDPITEKSSVIKEMPLSEGKNWATKELLEFVAHMKNGDTTMLSYFDVHALLLEYVRINNLRDAHQKCQVLCDARLVNLFGKQRVGHVEMLKLLESHFLIDPSTTANRSVVEAVANQLGIDESHDKQFTMTNDKRRKTRKKVDERGQQTNLDEYAAIDIHNITLIYLKRDLMERLIDDADKFHEKVVGSIVRIRISGSDQKQNMYRLVQVVGTSKSAEPYKIGTRTTNLMLEILNLQKKEVVSIDEISNQDFSKDECRWLRQCIKCGLMKQLKVGYIQKKAMALQALRVNVWLESEILRLEHLRDRANEKGLRKELRECIEKLRLLHSPKERQRRLHEIPEVHADPNMKPSIGFTEDTGELDEKKKDNLEKPRIFDFGRREREPTASLKGGDALDDIGNRENTAPSYSAGMEMKPSICSIETDKIWHYQDPSGNIQGPFSMTMLRKWSVTGHFPHDLRIWRVNGKEDDSILLTDALDGKYCKQTDLFENNSSSTQWVRIASADEKNDGCKGDTNVKHLESKGSEARWNSMENGATACCNGNNKFIRSNECGPDSSPCVTTVDGVNSNGGQNENPLPQGDAMKVDNHSPGQYQVCSSLPSSTFSGQPFESLSLQTSQSHEVEGCVSGQSNVNSDLNKTSEEETVTACGTEGGSEGKASQSCGQSWISPSLSRPSNGWSSDFGLISLFMVLEAAELSKEIIFSDLLSPTPKSSHGNSQGQAAENKQSPSSNIPVQDSVPSWSTASSLVGGGPQLPDVAGEWGGYSSTPTKPVDEWDSNLVTQSSLRPTELASDHAATPTSGSCQLTHSSPTHLPTNISSWPEIVPERVSDLSLADESVSDLLAEVEAMESLSGLTSPTSILRCSGELTQGSEHDCFSPVDGLSPPLDPVKSDAWSSTSDRQVPSQSTVTTEPFAVPQAEIFGAQKRSGSHSSTSAEMDEDTRPDNISARQSITHFDTSPMTTWGMTTRDATWRPGLDTRVASWGTVNGNSNLYHGGLGQENIDLGYGTDHIRVQENGSMNSGTYDDNAGYWANQTRYSGPRDRNFQGKDSSFNRGRSSWNGRQSFHPGGNDVGSYRAPPKGQRVCKFHESGYCKKGSLCSFLHP